MTQSLSAAFPDLRFTPQQIYLTDPELALVVSDFWKTGATLAFSHRDRAFIQAALFVAVDASEKAGLLFGIYKSFVGATPSQSLVKLAQKLATTGAKYAYQRYIDDDPKYSAVGRAAVQYGGFATEWRVRAGTGDESALSDFTA
ncbi:hypothetical protein [Vannielia litorea]|uniref:Uncharacterized protein n=1 Tax=Vannielia litorea TaxID=1217970 RepID=A0A1N6G149_9RHOB|nr:hypothetical protein [Vannielia litorea]SIO01306.1 hypothetical protein SAMN05444002_2124 [Vannielia litorea]